MKAIVYERYGPPDVFQIAEIEKPTPNEDQVLVKVLAASANPLDWHRMRGEPFLVRLSEGLRKPKNPKLGADITGRVEAVGKNVTEFKPRDEVFGSVGAGGFAEYVCAREKYFASKPGNISFEAAAAAPVVGFTALQGLRDTGQIRAGQKVLVNGAAGGWGRLLCKLPNPTERKLLACVAQGIWTWCARLAPTTWWITREKISPKTVRRMMSYSIRLARARFPVV